MEVNFREIGPEAVSGTSSGSVTGFWMGGFTCVRNAKNSIAVRYLVL